MLYAKKDKPIREEDEKGKIAPLPRGRDLLRRVPAQSGPSPCRGRDNLPCKQQKKDRDRGKPGLGEDSVVLQSNLLICGYYGYVTVSRQRAKMTLK